MVMKCTNQEIVTTIRILVIVKSGVSLVGFEPTTLWFTHVPTEKIMKCHVVSCLNLFVGGLCVQNKKRSQQALSDPYGIPTLVLVTRGLKLWS